MLALPGRVEVRIHHSIRYGSDIRPVPVRGVVLVDQPGPHAFRELRVAAAVQAHRVLHAEHLGSRQMACAADLFPDQMSGQRAARGEGLRSPRDQRVLVIGQCGEGVPGLGDVGAVQHRIQAFAARQQLGIRQFTAGFVFQCLQQAVQLHVGLFAPVQLHQAFDQVFLLGIEQEAVGEVQVQCVAGVHLRGGQAEEQAEAAGQAGEEPARADVRVQADVHFRHGQAAAGRYDAHAGALHQAHAAAHHVAVGPADQRFAVGVDEVVQAVFVGEEAAGEGGNFAGLLAAGVHQLAHVAAGAEGLAAVAAQHHAGDLRVVLPHAQLMVHRLDHRQAQGVQALLRVQRHHADAEAVQAGAFFEHHIHGRGLIGCASADRVSPGRRSRLRGCHRRRTGRRSARAPPAARWSGRARGRPGSAA